MAMKVMFVARAMYLTAGNSLLKMSILLLKKVIKLIYLDLLVNQTHWTTTEKNIDTLFIFNQMEDLSFTIQKQTVVVLDNASIHTAKRIQEQIPFWQQRGLFIFYLPPYSPQLNIAETLWRKMKREWIDPDDYLEKDNLFYAINRFLANVGTNVNIKFSDFNIN